MHLVLDLDETLISVSVLRPNTYDFSFILNGTTYYGKKRPGLDLFLRFAFKNFETVSIWTAATREYAVKIVKYIMTEKQIAALMFFKTRKDLAMSPGGSYFKPLRTIFTDPKAKTKGITPETTVMIDDKAEVLRDNPGSGILIPAWKGVQSDKYLHKLLIVLDGIVKHGIVFGHFGKVMDLTSIVD